MAQRAQAQSKRGAGVPACKVNRPLPTYCSQRSQSQSQIQGRGWMDHPKAAQPPARKSLFGSARPPCQASLLHCEHCVQQDQPSMQCRPSGGQERGMGGRLWTPQWAAAVSFAVAGHLCPTTHPPRHAYGLQPASGYAQAGARRSSVGGSTSRSRSAACPPAPCFLCISGA